MTDDTTPKRIAQVGSDTFVIAREGDHFRMYAPGNPKEMFTVRITDKDTVCTCADFIEKGGDPEYRCRHILAIQKIPNGPTIPSPAKAPSHAPKALTPEVAPGNGARHMLLKRSVSPDGRIDSLSVEFSLPLESSGDAELVEKANAALAIQSMIIEGFLGGEKHGNGNGNGKGNSENVKAAKIISYGFRPTRWGTRSALTFEVGSDRVTLFGSRERIREVLSFAGYPALGQDLSSPFEASLACRVTLRKSDDGKYTNVDRVYPVEARQ